MGGAHNLMYNHRGGLGDVGKKVENPKSKQKDDTDKKVDQDTEPRSKGG